MRLLSDPNLLGVSKYDQSPAFVSAFRVYQNCLSLNLKSLEPLDVAKIPQIEALPRRCASERASSLSAAVSSLVSAGASESEARRDSENILNQLDESVASIVASIRRLANER